VIFHRCLFQQGERWDKQHERAHDAEAQKEKSIFDRINAKKERERQLKLRVKSRQRENKLRRQVQLPANLI
jgi:hypothetical protein